MWLRLSRIALLELTKLPPSFRLLRFTAPHAAQIQLEGDAPQADQIPLDDDDPTSPRSNAARGRKQLDCTHDDPTSPRSNAARGRKQLDCAQDFADDSAGEDNNNSMPVQESAVEEFACSPSEARALRGWERILLRVLKVAADPPEHPAGLDDRGSPQDLAGLERTMETAVPLISDGYPPRQGHAQICLGDLMEESITWMEVDSEDDQNSPKAIDQVQLMEEEEEESGPEAVPPALRDLQRQQNAPGIVAGMQKCLSF